MSKLLLLGAGGVLTFGDVYGTTLPASQTQPAITVVTRFKIASLTVPPGPVTQIKLEVTGNIAKLYVGAKSSGGDAYDASSLAQVTFGGSGSLSQADGAKTLSDPISFAWDKVSDILASVYWSASMQTNYLNSGNAATDSYFAVGSDEASLANKTSGYSFISGATYCVNRIVTDGF